MSLGGATETTADVSPPTQESVNPESSHLDAANNEANNEEVQEDDDELQMALQLSMSAGAEATQPAAGNSDFINQLLGSVGVDQDDPLVRAALEQLAQSQGSHDEKRPAPSGDNGSESKKKREE
jgi:hypothetical protein